LILNSPLFLSDVQSRQPKSTNLVPLAIIVRYSIAAEASAATLNLYTVIDDTLVQSVGSWIIPTPLNYRETLVIDAEDRFNYPIRGSALIVLTIAG
jgi:hypothetical protein